MINLGVDIGSETLKAVIINNDTIISDVVIQSSDKAEVGYRKLIDQTLLKASLRVEDIDNEVFTGREKQSISFIRKSYSEPICHARGVKFLFPEARTILITGAHGSTAVSLGEGNKIKNFISSDKCAGATGMFLSPISKILQIPLQDFDAHAKKANQKVSISNACAVFAESEVISLIHSRISKEDIVAGIIDAISERLAGLFKRIKVNDQVVMTGGLARMQSLVQSMESKLGCRILVPGNPLITGALGAALLGGNSL
ncbi:MAG: acyl-CoA dehydratase activase [Desulfobacterales bacterium]|jgi:predicted CoA-substrate-specific enzyme activase|nr:acyl-CoA dehydratase activase [Desulfobacterales bacterium]